MKSKRKLMGLIFANTHDKLVHELTVKRAMASVPFGGRYRLIDFSVSNMANAEITKVGVIARQNYMSLMEHIESGKSYDLARKSGGLFILPPNVAGANKIYHGHIQAIHDIYDFLDMASEDYVVLSDADVVSNIDIKDMFKKHNESGADITIAYKRGMPPIGYGDTMEFCLGDENRIKDIILAPDTGRECNYSLDIAIFNKRQLIEVVDDAYTMGYDSISKDIYKRLCGSLDIRGYEVTTYTAVIDSMASFFKANMDLLNSKNRAELLRSERTVMTKVRDETPVIYGLEAKVKNSLIADGCEINGTIENSVISRQVKIGKGAVVKNCVILNDSEIGENAKLEYVCADRNSHIADDKEIRGIESCTVFLSQDANA